LSYWTSETPSLKAKFEIADGAFADAQDWLGSENFHRENEKWIATVTLPDDEALVRKILGLGVGVKVLSPTHLKERVAKAARNIVKAYE
jgi:predicted DNA-binding transcriptional regulator YafY